jgi:hypothetical protein
MTDLDKLIAAVEAGTATGGDGAAFVPMAMSELIISVMKEEGDAGELWSDFIEAHDGSLDAALRLHEALLLGWGWAVEGKDACVWHPDTGGVSRDMVASDNPARAWLLAILKAVRGERCPNHD